MPCRCRPERRATAFSSVICMITVLAAVICGVTFSVSAASLKVTVTVLFASVCTGICTPCVISASTLFCVVTRGVDRMRPLPDRSSADSAMSRLNAPLIEPSASPTALVARRHAPGSTAVPADRRGLARMSVPAPRALQAAGRPPSEPLFGNARPVVLPMFGVDAAVEAPLHAERPGEVARRRDDARLDLDLRLGAIERRRAAARRCRAAPAGR